MREFGIVSSLIVYVMFTCLGLLLLLATKQNSQAMSLQMRLFIVAFTIRFAFALMLYEFRMFPQLQEPDAAGWVGGVGILRAWDQEGVGFFGLPQAMMGGFGGRRGYQHLLALFFYLTGTAERVPAAALNCFLGALTVVFAYRAARLLFSPAVAVRVGILACIFPSMIVWSAQTLKEPVVILLETIGLYACISLRRSGFTLRHAFMCAATILLLLMFRFYAAYVATAAFALTLLWPHTSRKTGLGSAFAIAALLGPILLLSGVLARQEVRFEEIDIEYVERFRKNVATGQGSGSGVVMNYDLNTPGGMLMAIGVGAAHLMLAPFPWQLIGGSSRMLFTTPELLVWWWLFIVGLVPGAWYCIRKRFADVLPLAAFVLGMGLLYSVMFGNVGLVYRQRSQLLPWLFIFTAVGLERRAQRKRALRRAYAEAIQHRASLRPSPALERGY